MGMQVVGISVMCGLMLWMAHGLIDRGPPSKNANDWNVPGKTAGSGKNSLAPRPSTAP
jgi:hypothetical protein